MTACLIQWLVCLTAIQEVPCSIPSYTLEFFLKVQGLERGPPSLVRIIGQLLDMRSSEIWLKKLKLRLRDDTLLTTRPLYCHLVATATVGLGSPGLQCHIQVCEGYKMPLFLTDNYVYFREPKTTYKSLIKKKLCLCLLKVQEE